MAPARYPRYWLAGRHRLADRSIVHAGLVPFRSAESAAQRTCWQCAGAAIADLGGSGSPLLLKAAEVSMPLRNRPGSTGRAGNSRPTRHKIW